MDIVYFGHSSFKISGRDASVVTDPFNPTMLGIRYPKVSADIVTVSHDHEDHNYVSAVSDVHKIISGPGEYEVRGISIIGIGTYHDDKKGTERGNNTIYVYEVDGIRIAHLGDLGHKLSESQINLIGDIDVLMVPVGGVYTIDAQTAIEVTQSIEPNIIIPMHYKIPGLKEDVFGELLEATKFTSALGAQVEEMPKLSLKPGAVSENEQRTVVLTIK